jgi:hypothetical protein
MLAIGVNMNNQEKIWVLENLIISNKNMVASAQNHLITEQDTNKITAFQKTISRSPAKIEFFEEQIRLLTNNE